MFGLVRKIYVWCGERNFGEICGASNTNSAMSVFKFPAGLCDELSQIIRNFWWGDEEDRKRVHWMAWDNMTKPKCKGGMGFQDLRLFNQALLAKQGITHGLDLLKKGVIWRINTG
jgi:hypothetical protein